MSRANYKLTLELRPAIESDFKPTDKDGAKHYAWDRMYWVKAGPETFSFHLFAKGSLHDFGTWFKEGLVYVSDKPEWMVKAQEHQG